MRFLWAPFAFAGFCGGLVYLAGFTPSVVGAMALAVFFGLAVVWGE